jgi:predicted RNA-binding Zn ribbon-like protein
MPSSGKTTPENVHLWGGALCLDFANSVDWTPDDEPLDPAMTDALAEPGQLARWGRRVGLPARGRPDADELAAAHTLRSDLHLLFSAIAHDATPPTAPLERLARDHAEATAAAGLEPDDGAAWRLAWAPSDPRLVRFAVIADAVALLGDADRLARVRQCPGDRCGWLFVDASGRRRWCSMQTCGSRAKMRRLYERRRAGGRGPSGRGRPRASRGTPRG